MMLGRIRGIFLGTRTGRMALLGAGLAGFLLLAPHGCLRRSRPAPGESRDVAVLPDAGKGTPDQIPPSPGGFQDTLTLGQKYEALIHRWGGELQRARGELDSTRKEIEALRSALTEERASHAREKDLLQDTLQNLELGLKRRLGPGDPAASTRGPEPAGSPAPVPAEAPAPCPERGGLRLIPMREGPRKDEAAPDGPPRTVHLPCASGGQATLLNGVFAPTTGEPSPVRLRLDAALVGPNRSRIPLRGAFLIGRAQGDANASRVTIQVDRLSRVRADGRAVESRVLGYVVGEDGLEGVPGTYEWRALELLPYAAIAGGVAGGSEALSLGETSRSITPLGGAIESVTGNALKYAGLRSISGGAGKLSELVVERMREIRPAVSARPGQSVTVVFLEGVPLEGMEFQEKEADESAGAYRGLDIHR